MPGNLAGNAERGRRAGRLELELAHDLRAERGLTATLSDHLGAAAAAAGFVVMSVLYRCALQEFADAPCPS